MPAAAQELGVRIARMVSPGPVALTFENSSSLNAAEQETFKRELMEQLRGAGIRTVIRSAAAYEVVVTLAENLRGFVFAAQALGVPNQPYAAIVMLPRGISGLEARGGSGVVLRKTAILEQETPILDFAQISAGGGLRLLVLESERVVIYARSGNAWQTEQARMNATLPSFTLPRP